MLLMITLNVYSQKVDCLERCFYCTGKNVIYMDSTIVNGKTVYTDSLIVKVSVLYTDSIVSNGLVVYTDSSITYSPLNYDITLKNSFPFTSAIYRNECEYLELIKSSFIMFWYDEENKTISDNKKGYFIYSSDKKYIKYAYIKDVDGELYIKYNPIIKDNIGNVSFSINQFSELSNWMQNEMNKGKIVSLGYKNEQRFICKSFDTDSLRIIDKYTSTNYNETQTWAHQQMEKGYQVDIDYNKAHTYFAIALKKEN